MLKSFEVSNFKSYKNHTKFDLEKTNYQMLVTTNIKDDVLKGLMFVGGNASGKSNAILGIKFLLDFLFGKNDVNPGKYMCLFSGNPIMRLKYAFEIEKNDIVYEIQYQKIDDKFNEDLYVNGENVFSRDGSVARVRISEDITHTDVPNDTLFLRDIYFSTKFRGHEVLRKWFEFLRNSVYVDVYDRSIVNYKDIELWIHEYLEQNGAEKINAFFEEYNFEQTIEYGKQAQGNLLQIETNQNTIFFKRKGIEEPMPFTFESLGNRNLLEMLPAFFYCVNNNGMLLLDEFSSGFHNELEELLIRYFMKNSDKSQLICVSHSTNLLTNRLLRPDQIYSVEFREDGSHIKRFSSEKPREAQNLEKMYLGGVFSGIPKYEYTTK